MKINSEQEMIKKGEAMAAACPSDSSSQAALAKSLRSVEHIAAITSPYVIELVGDVGVGKTTFVRGLAKGLGIEEPITSPSFTISKSYACPDGRTLIHYDFYRLDDPGLMAEDLEENLKNPHNIVVIEWSDTVKDILPKEHITVNIKYNDDGSREVETLE